MRDTILSTSSRQSVHHTRTESCYIQRERERDNGVYNKSILQLLCNGMGVKWIVIIEIGIGLWGVQ